MTKALAILIITVMTPAGEKIGTVKFTPVSPAACEELRREMSKEIAATGKHWTVVCLPTEAKP